MTIVSIVIAAVVGWRLWVLHHDNYRRTGELTERFIHEVLSDTLLDRKNEPATEKAKTATEANGAGRRPAVTVIGGMPAAVRVTIFLIPGPTTSSNVWRIAAVNAPRSTLCALANGVEVLARDLKRVHAAGAPRN
jgi:hypothetical protein